MAGRGGVALTSPTMTPTAPPLRGACGASWQIAPVVQERAAAGVGDPRSLQGPLVGVAEDVERIVKAGGVEALTALMRMARREREPPSRH